MENNEVLEAVETAIENDAVIVNYNVPQPTAKETLITTGVIAGVALVALGVTLGAVKVVDVTADAMYKLHEKRKAKKAARRAQCQTEAQENPEEK